jgi:tetratricopeptide (TPR) repeat protein
MFNLFEIEYLPDEKCFFILNPFDVIRAESRDYDDHIDFLINKNQFEEAIKAYENPPNPNQRPKRHNQEVIFIDLNSFNHSFLQSIYRAEAKYLMDRGETREAVKLFPNIYKTSNDWEDQILSFIQRHELDVNIILMIIRIHSIGLDHCTLHSY